MSHPDCPRQMTFTIPGVPGVKITATEVGGTIQFLVDVQDTAGSTGDLRALFFHIDPDELPGLIVSSPEGPAIFKEWRVGSNNIIDLDDGANLSGKVKQGFDVGIEWGTPGGKKDDINYEVEFTISNGSGDLTLDDLGGMLFGAKLDSVGGPGGPRGSTSKLTTFAPFAPDAIDDVKNIYEDGAADANSPSKTPQAIQIDVLANDTDGDTPQSEFIIHEIVQQPSSGTVTIAADGKSVYYTPALDFSGTVEFWYCMEDGTGNQDSAKVTVNIEAVADDPLISFSVAQGSSINETLVTVTATQNDADGSEDIDSLAWSVDGGLPAGVTITPLGPIAGSGDQLVQQFTVTTDPGVDFNFDIDFTAISKEDTAPFDTESNSGAQKIEIDFSHNQTDFTFETVDQSIWGTGSGEPFHEDPFIGLENVGFSVDTPWIPVSLVPPAAIDIDGGGSVTFGFDTVIHFDAGNIDAKLFVTATIDSVYNKTTDTLQYNTSYLLTGGSFMATGPSGYVNVDFVFDISGNISVSLEPLDFLTGWANIGTSFDEGTTIDVLDLTTDGASLDWDLLPGIVNLTLSWPDTDITSALLTGSTSDHFLDLNVDVDAAAITLFPLLAPLDPNIYSEDDLELVAVDVFGYLELIQELTLGLDKLNGTITLEDGAAFNFEFGDTLGMMSNFSGHDSDENGIITYDVLVTPEATLESIASVGIGVGAKVEFLRNLPFDLDSVVVFDEELPIADFDVFSDQFAIEGFTGQTWDLLA